MPRTSRRLQSTFIGARDHPITHVVVANLGTNEIVLCAVDDGDVLAYYTGSVERAIERRQEDKTGLLSNLIRRRGRDLSPFFHANVGRGVWGLAVHTQSRKIAVSANTRRITVFAFALTSTPSPSSSSSSDDVHEDYTAEPELTG